MIYDALENAAAYRALSPAFAAAFDFLGGGNLDALNERLDLIEGEAYVLPQTPSLREGGPWEAHRRFADIQIALADGETILCAPLSALSDWSDYDEKGDCLLTSADTERKIALIMKRGDFAVFFPWDAHKPCIGQGTVKKLVIKVRV